jgi:hypothetical protein
MYFVRLLKRNKPADLNNNTSFVTNGLRSLSLSQPVIQQLSSGSNSPTDSSSINAEFVTMEEEDLRKDAEVKAKRIIVNNVGSQGALTEHIINIISVKSVANTRYLFVHWTQIAKWFGFQKHEFKDFFNDLKKVFFFSSND